MEGVINGAFVLELLSQMFVEFDKLTKMNGGWCYNFGCCGTDWVLFRVQMGAQGILD